MTKPTYFLAILSILLSFNCSSDQSSTKSKTQYVNPFIGTGGHGHTFPGATVPFGMVQLSPDTRLTGWDGCSGYHNSDNVVYGFSHTHLSGTGISDYGDVLLMPTIGELRLHNGADGKDGYRCNFKKENEVAEPGYYKTTLDQYGIVAELSAAKRVGIHKYTYPAETTIGNLILDLEHRDLLIDASINIIDQYRIEGHRISNAWAKEQHIYFALEMSKPIAPGGLVRAKGGKKINGFKIELGDKPEILIKVAISAVSIENAWKNMETDLPHWAFSVVKEQAQKAWEKALSKIEVEGGTEDQKTIFYTALYHTMIAPNLYMDYNGQYRGMDLEVHKANDFTNYTVFSLWDTYRAANPLYTILEPTRTGDFINSLLAKHDDGGILPIWPLAGNYTDCMIGYHAIPVIADAYLKGIPGFDPNRALDIMQHAANQEHFGLRSYKSMGYVSSDDEAESVSRTLEYAFDDWCIAQMAKKLGQDSVARQFLNRSQYYKNQFDASTGFMRAKRNNMWWQPFNPKEVNSNYTEANAWQYSFYAPHDIEGLMDLFGGAAAFEQKLDALFSEESGLDGRQQDDITGLIGQYAHGNEPSHHIAYLYNFVGKPWKTADRVRQILEEMYSNQPDGLSGNEDCGQMSAWYVLSAMGFYPVTPGSNSYIIGSPIFPKVTINLENGKQFTIQSKNVSAENKYIQSASLNGAAYTKSYITHADILNGSELILNLGSKPNETWGTQAEDIAMTKIDQGKTMPLPFVKTGERVFKESTSIEISSQAPVYYSINGAEPIAEKANLYKGPFELNKTTTLKFFSVSAKGIQSPTLESKFFKILPNRNVSLSTQYSPQYTGGGDNALIDFQRGGEDFRLGEWQGYEGLDLNAVIDLGKMESHQKLALSCIQHRKSWIFLPTEVQFLTSNDGKKFTPLGTVSNDVDPKKQGFVLKEFEINKRFSARYIKVIGKNRRVCPPWHVGAGSKAWVFVDEVVIE